MSCLRSLSIQSSLALATPVDSHCVSQELRPFDATKTSIPSTPFSTRASLPGSRQIQRALRGRCLTSVSQLLWPSDELDDAACPVAAGVAWLPDRVVDEEIGVVCEVKRKLTLLGRRRICRFNCDHFDGLTPRLLDIGENCQDRQTNHNHCH